MDGQKKPIEALNEYKVAGSLAEAGSYNDLDSQYNMARMNLLVWLDDRADEHIPYLLEAANEWRQWLDTFWSKEPTKLWAYYHAACAYHEITLLNINRASLVGAEFRDAEQKFNIYKEQFLSEARAQVGVKKYEVRFSSFLLTSADYQHFPGEPLKCQLDAILNEFKIH